MMRATNTRRAAYRRTLAGAAAAFVTCAASALADTYPRQSGVDAWHYVFPLEMSDTRADINAQPSVDLRFTKDGIAKVALDLASASRGTGITVSSGTGGGRPPPYNRHDNVPNLT